MTRREREVLVDQLIHGAWWFDSRHKPGTGKPGQVIAAFPTETRRKLEELTAADFQHRQE
jgi:hypothetical protein